MCDTVGVYLSIFQENGELTTYVSVSETNFSKVHFRIMTPLSKEEQKRWGYRIQIA
jgi:hypothetical protein